MYLYPAEFRDLFQRYTRGPAELREAVRGLDTGAVSRRPLGADQWNVRDIVMHLADSELVEAVRLRIALAGEDTPLPRFDENAWQRRLQYLWRSPEAALAQVEAVRFATAEVLYRTDARGWANEARWPSGETVSVHALVVAAVRHTDEHVAAILTTRGLAPSPGPGGA